MHSEYASQIVFFRPLAHSLARDVEMYAQKKRNTHSFKDYKRRGLSEKAVERMKKAAVVFEERYQWSNHCH